MKLRGLRFDSGYEDEFQFIPPNARALSSVLTNLGIPHKFEEYNGDHPQSNPRKRWKNGNGSSALFLGFDKTQNSLVDFT